MMKNIKEKKGLITKAGIFIMIVFFVLSIVSVAGKTSFTPITAATTNFYELNTTRAVGDVIWENGGPKDATVSSQLDTAVPFNSQTADDFIFESETEIGGVGWYGGLWNGPPNDMNPCDFNIYIYDDDGSGTAPTGGGTSNPETTAVAAYSFEEVLGESIGDYAYSYEVTLDPVFVAEQNVKYWIVIQAVFNFPPQWGWFNSENPSQLSLATQGFPYLEMPFWTALGEDQAFYLLGEGGGGSSSTELEIQDISGGMGVSVVIKNVGDNDATNLDITLEVSGGFLGRINTSSQSLQESLSVDGEITEKSDIFFGLGPITIEVTANATNAEMVSKSVTAFVFGPFVLGVK
jgi:hypothetical protein